MSLFSKIFRVLVLCALPTGVWAQASVDWVIPTPNFLYQCADSSLFSIRITNTTGVSMVNITLTIAQPVGIVKVGSVSATVNNSPVSINDPVSNNNSNAPVFTFPSAVVIPDNETMVVNYWAKALCNTANLSYTNTVTVGYSDGVTPANVVETSLAYTTQIPFLELDNAGTATTNVSCANDQFTQVVRVSNQGNFNSLMEFLDIEIVHPASVTIISTSIGTIQTVGGNTIVRLADNDFVTVGNNDDVLDFDEQIEITITGRLNDCIATNQLVTFQPLYKCSRSDATVCRRVPETIQHTLNVTSVDTPPTLTATTSCALNSTASGLTITNTGTFTSQFTRVNITIPTTCECQAIDFSTLQGSLNGGMPFTITPTATTTTGSACLSGNPNNARVVTFNLPNLAPTDVLALTWTSPLCGSGACADASLYWQYDILYQSTCCPNTIRNIGTGTCTVMPQLTAVINPTCTNGTKSITITNNGNKDASDVAIRLNTGATHLSGIVAGSANASSGTLVAGATTLANVCSSATLLREANYILSTIPTGGGSVTITWDISSCQNFQSCQGYNSEDYGYQIQYAQSCSTGTLTLNGNHTTPENSEITDTDNNLITTISCPTTTTYTLPLRVDGQSLSYNSRYVEIVLDLPANVAWNGNAPDLLLNGNAPISTTLAGNTLTIRYNLPAGALPTTINPTFNINCAIVCNGVQPIEYALNTYNDCNGNNALLHTCNGTQFLDIDTTNPDCPFPIGFGCVAPNPQPTLSLRTNFGQDDFDDNRFADGNPLMQNSRLRQRLMYTDTLRTIYSGTISSSPNTDTLVVNLVLYHPQGGDYNYLTLYDLDFNFTDLSTGITYNLPDIYTCGNIASVRDTLNARIYTLAITQAAVEACYPALLPTNFAFDAGDIVRYDMRHRVSSNIGLTPTPRVLQVRTDMYLINNTILWQDPLPIFPGCPNVPMDEVEVVGYQYAVGATQTSGDICHNTIDVTITHDFNIQATGNLNIFPFEDRRWVRFQTIKVTLPTGFTCDPALSVWYAEPFAVALPAPPSFTQVGNVITFTLIGGMTNYYTANNLSSDDGNLLRFRLTLSTLCNAQPTSQLLAEYTYDSNLPLVNDLPTQATFNINTNLPIINYDITNSPTSCTGTQATWTFSVANSNTSNINPASPYYNWLHIEFPAGSNFTNPVLTRTDGVPTVVTPDIASGFYLLGDIPKGTTRTYTLTVDYPTSAGATCYNNALKLFYDWSCTPINTSFTTANFKTGYTCRYDSTQLGFTAGANTVLIDVLNTSYNTVRVCEENTYVARVRNVGQNPLRNVKVTVNAPTGFNFIAGSFEYEYPPAMPVAFNNGDIIIPNFAVGGYFDITFKYNTTCLDDLVGNAQFILDVDVETCCAGDDIAAFPMPVLDVSQIYAGEHRFGLTLNNAPNLTCTNDITTFSITVRNNGTQNSDNTDHVLVTIPTGMQYVAGSITSDSGVAISDADITTTGNQIYWRINHGASPVVMPTQSRTFTINLEDITATPTCANFAVRVQTFEQGIAACEAIGLTCTRQRITGTRTRRIRTANTNFVIADFQPTSYAVPALSQLSSGNIIFRNNGPNVIAAGTAFDVLVYFDNVYNSTITITVPAQISIGGTYTYAYTNIPCGVANGVCDVRVQLPLASPNCICTTSQDQFNTGLPLSSPQVQLKGQLNQAKEVALSWETSAMQIKSFVVERSNGTNGYSDLATVLPENGKTKYEYTDKTVQDGWYYYRVRINYENGLSARTNLIAIDVPLQEISLDIAPNPFEKDICLKFSHALAGELDLQILDHAGKEIWGSEEEVAGKDFVIQNTHLPTGVYLLRVQYKHKVWTKTIVKK
jgi:uncharacterized repeat protein (TIGR01451 family)